MTAHPATGRCPVHHAVLPMARATGLRDGEPGDRLCRVRLVVPAPELLASRRSIVAAITAVAERMSRWDGARRWLSNLWKPVPFKSNGRCPVCSTPIVVLPTTYMGSQYSGPMMVRRTKEEQIAACPTHGRSPFNDLSVRALHDRNPD